MRAYIVQCFVSQSSSRLKAANIEESPAVLYCINTAEMKGTVS